MGMGLFAHRATESQNQRCYRGLQGPRDLPAHPCLLRWQAGVVQYRYIDHCALLEPKAEWKMENESAGQTQHCGRADGCTRRVLGA